MDYEKKYNEALERAQKAIRAGGDVAMEIVQHIFPELRESEDERIRKEMIAYFAHRADVTEFIDEGEDCKRWIAYLEKQKLEEVQGPPQEEKQVSLTHEPPFDENPSDKEIIEALIKHLKEQDGFLTAIDCVSTKAILSWLEKQKESHIPWYDYQKSKEAGYTIVPNEEYEQLIKQKEQKPAWSEEDERIVGRIQMILEFFDRNYPADRNIGSEVPKYISWLKSSLRPSWKPSDQDELMKLKYAGTSTKLD